MHTHKTQVAVLGAGPAGSIAARQLGLAGLDVLLIDPCVAPKGHGIESFPLSGALLADEIGLLQTLYQASDGPAETMQMLWRDTPEVRAFEGAGPLLLHREAMRASLRKEAMRYVAPLYGRVKSVATTEYGVELLTTSGNVQADMVIHARGRHVSKRKTSDLTALPFTAQGDLPAHTMWLEAMPAGWIWACTLSDRTLQGVVFQPATILAGKDGLARAAYVTSCLTKSDTFADMRAINAGKPTAAGLSAAGDPVVTDRHLLVGDAALARDPIASHGLVHAMRSAVQSAIAVLTILDRAGDTRAAHSFLRHKHREAFAAAQRATQRAYADQSRFQTAFWAEIAPLETLPALPVILEGPVTLAAPLTRAPVLEADRIRWAAAIELPVTDEFVTALGAVTALDIAAACRPAASLHDIANRLGRQHDMPLVFEVLERLTLGGAFAQAEFAR
ncbi:MAG: tryptophan 7-halogenase [Sulfitobacter sp.]